MNHLAADKRKVEDIKNIDIKNICIFVLLPSFSLKFLDFHSNSVISKVCHAIIHPSSEAEKRKDSNKYRGIK
jgi:hypothetical protein